MNNIPSRSPMLLDHLTKLVNESRPFTYEGAMQALKCTDEAIRYHMRKLSAAGSVTFTTMRVGNDYDYSVTVTGLGSTPWNDLNGRLARRSEQVRQNLVAWRKRSGWSLNQVASAVSALNDQVLNSCQISRLLEGATMQVDFLRMVSKLIDDYRNPGSFEQWQNMIARRAKARKLDESDEILRRVEQVERERDERRRALLAAERGPRKVQQRDYLDKATLAALSGQVVGQGRVYG
ncbi:hypothetical protein OOT33_13485 [Sphingobium sp. DEHP117]|uniref:hypothetical protein n=1 Tax=Sphingobium sp. DEHP117 TaxID=2993436 RepID=UPI0027D51E33|nr:hypothetical protein [Sphingobium sp. DEHP117]MDQ4421434.1 hypothetical protein [Sphingobium sp. DEHP117]